MTTYQDLEREALEEKTLTDEYDQLILKLDNIDRHLAIIKSQIHFLCGSIEHLRSASYDKDTVSK